MSYAYTDGVTGLAGLLTTEPDGASEPVSNLDDAVVQVKKYLNDSTLGPLPTTVVFPINSIQLTYGSLDPNNYLPGTWVAIAKGRMLIGSGQNDQSNNGISPSGSPGGETFAANATGGASNGSSGITVTGTSGETALTKAQIPPHVHEYTDATQSAGASPRPNGGTAQAGEVRRTPTVNGNTSENGSSDGVGSGGAGGNGAVHTHGAGSYAASLFPYFVVNVWVRTA